MSLGMVLLLGLIANIIAQVIKAHVTGKATKEQAFSMADQRISKYMNTVDYSPAQQAAYKRKVKRNTEIQYNHAKKTAERETFSYWLNELDKVN